MNILERIKKIEQTMKRTRPPGDEDGFLAALGVDKEPFAIPGRGYDFIAALSATAAADWKDK